MAAIQLSFKSGSGDSQRLLSLESALLTKGQAGAFGGYPFGSSGALLIDGCQLCVIHERPW